MMVMMMVTVVFDDDGVGVTTERMFTMENARMAAKRCTAGESLMMSRCVPDRKMMRVIMSW